MSRLTMSERRALPLSDYAIPEKAPGPGSYPIHDAKHQVLALQLASGKPEEARVIRAVQRKRRGLA